MTIARRFGPTARRNRPAAAGGSLWRSEGARTAQVEARFTPEGGLTLHHHETGPTLLSAWGKNDYEATLEISPEDLRTLTLLLLQAGFGGQRDALEQLRIYCERHGVPHRVAVWT